MRTLLGDALTAPAMVQLNALGQVPVTLPTKDGGRVFFNGIALGRYTIVVEAPGYETKTEDVSLDAPGPNNIFVYMRPVGTQEKSGPPVPPTLAPKADAEVKRGLQSLHDGNLDQAQSKFEHAAKMAPGNPYPHYLLGIVWGRRNDLERSRKEFETAVGIDPHYGVAQFSLGDLLLRQNDWPGAIRALEEAVANGSGTSEAHWMLGWAYFNSKQFDKVLSEANKAQSLATKKSPELDLLRAQALAGLGRRTEAITVLNKFLAENPMHRRADMARTWLKQLNEPASTAATAKVPSTTADTASPGAANSALGAASTTEAPNSDPDPPSAAWAPPDVDSTAPAFEPGTSCDQAEVIHSAEVHAETLADNLDRFAATERVDVAEVYPTGSIRMEQTETYDFMAAVQHWKGNLILDESRLLRGKSAAWDVSWLTSGLAELAFIFHPYYESDFTLTCEGLTRWRGEPAWSIHFQQRDDRPARFRAYAVKSQTYFVKLKGRALIGANNHELLRIETDLMEPVKQIPLVREHLAIDYAPVQFKQRNTRLWLPHDADLFFLIKGHRYHYSHHLSDFTLFSVDTQQQVKNPKQLQQAQQPPAQP